MTKKVTNSSQSGVIEKATVAPAAIPVSEHVDFGDVPFIAKQKEGRRPYLNNPTHEPVVEIAGKKFELKDIDIDKVPFDLNDFVRGSVNEDNILTCKYRKRAGYYGNYDRHQKLPLSNLKFKHVNVDGVDIYISVGSSLIVSNDFSGCHYYAIDDSKQISSSLVLVVSDISTPNLVAVGKNVLFNSYIKSGNTVNLLDSSINNSKVSNTVNSLVIDDSNIGHSCLYSEGFVTITDTEIQSATISTSGSLTLDRVMGGGSFNLAKSYTFKVDLRISNLYLHPLNFDGHVNNESMGGYKPVTDYPSRIDNGIVIERRIDYGVFSSINELSFVRLNEHDILVHGYVFSVKDFFPEYIVNPEPVELKAPVFGPYSYQPPVHYNIGLGGYDRNSELWKRAAVVAFKGNKGVLGKTGETIVNSLLDQIKSRINLYIEISSLI